MDPDKSRFYLELLFWKRPMKRKSVLCKVVVSASSLRRAMPCNSISLVSGVCTNAVVSLTQEIKGFWAKLVLAIERVCADLSRWRLILHAVGMLLTQVLDNRIQDVFALYPSIRIKGKITVVRRSRGDHERSKNEATEARLVDYLQKGVRGVTLYGAVPSNIRRV